MKNILITLILSSFLVMSCKKDAPLEEQTYSKIVLCYFAGDNNLSQEVTKKIEAIREGLRNTQEPNSKVLCYADFTDAPPSLFEIGVESNKNQIEFTEQNSASPVTLKEVIAHVRNAYKANSYGMILFSHASGWLPTGALNNPTLFKSETQKVKSVTMDGEDEMELEEFTQAIPQGMFEYILFEACYMAGIEVAYALREKTDYLIVSSAEIVSPGFEEIYPSSLYLLLRKKSDLHSFVQNYFELWDNKSSYLRSATISLINTEHLEELAAIVSEIVPPMELPQTTINVIQHFNRNPYHLFFDLKEYIYSLTDDQTALFRFETALSNVVEYQGATPRFLSGLTNSFIIRNHCGVTTYIPQSQFPNLNKQYKLTSWEKRTHNR